MWLSKSYFDISITVLSAHISTVSAQLLTDDALLGIRGHPGLCVALTDGASGLETVLDGAVWIVAVFSDLFSRFKCYVLLLSIICE